MAVRIHALSFVGVIGLAGALACGPGASPAASTPAAKVASSPKSEDAKVAPGPYGERVAEARAAGARASARPVPLYKGTGSKESRLAFMKTEGASWFADVKPEVDAAVAAWEAALDVAPSVGERLDAVAEAARVAVDFVERFVSIGRDAEPTEWRKEPELDVAYLRALVGSTEASRVRVRSVLERCDKLAGDRGDGRCAALRARLATLEDVPIAPAPLSAASEPTAKPRSPSRTACTCVPGDPMCSCAPREPKQSHPPKPVCNCGPGDPLCGC